jgi:hypothetical protein
VRALCLRRALLTAALLTLLGAAAAPATADAFSTKVTANDAVARDCIAEQLQPGEGIAHRSVTAPASGWVEARLEAASGDWDLAVFDAATGRRVAGSTFLGASEVAAGLAMQGQQLVVQACRRSGTTERATLTVEGASVSDAEPVRTSLVRVSTPTRARKTELTELGLDLTEHGGNGFVEVVLHGRADADSLRDAKFTFTTEVRDLVAESARHRAEDEIFARQVRASALPSGADKYRTLEEFNLEMKTLAEENPTLVKPFELPFETYEGRTVQGIEITENVNARDGKPVFLNMGVHHAREWPSGEHAMEWAYEMVNGYNGGNPRVTDLLSRSRVIVVPIVNPDGFNQSRTAGTAAVETRGGRGAPNPDEESETANIVANAATGEYRRKNCRLPDDSDAGNCLAGFAAGFFATGVDPNRNYGGLWGGPGASELGIDEDYRGPGPFSEPETRNIQDLVSRRHVTTLITNHTFSDLVLRPPGIRSLGDPPDENRGYKALGDAMAAENGYLSQKSFELYDTTGTTEDWSYGATGGYGFTFEIGCTIPEEESDTGKRIGCVEGHFHPPYSEVVAEYEGTTERAGDGEGNREAYFIALESTVNAERHSVIEGAAPAGAILRLKKSFKTKTSPVLRDGEETEVIEFEDVLDTTMEVPPSGQFEWHINPSTRPAVAKQIGRAPQGEPSPSEDIAGGFPATQPDPSDANSNRTVPPAFDDHLIEVPANGGGVDNAKVTVRVDWQTLGSDYDIRLFRDSNGNGVLDPAEEAQEPVAVSQQGTTDFEQVTLTELDFEPGNYILRVNNFAAAEPYTGTITFQGPLFQAAQVESWTLTCESPEGTVLDSRQVAIDRAQRQTLDLSGACAAGRIGSGTGTGTGVGSQETGDRDASSCFNAATSARGNRVGRAGLARSRATVRRTFGTIGRYRRFVDRYCLSDGGTVRIAYATPRERSRLSRSERRRIGRESIFVLTTSRSLRIRGVGRGTSERVMRQRIGRGPRVRVGRNTWYFRKGRNSRQIFKVQRGRVLEMGIADARLTAGTQRAKRFFRQGR